MPTLNLKPTHKPIRAYYESLGRFGRIGVTHETAVRSAFQSLLESCARQFDWTLVLEHAIALRRNKRIVVEGALIDAFNLPHGYWEAKDIHDDLDAEVERKFATGYPRDNILFQTPRRAILWQNDAPVLDADLTDERRLVETLETFFSHRPAEIAEWDEAVARFKDKVPDIGRGLAALIQRERQSNRQFAAVFADFYEKCRQSINPNLSRAVVEEMLIQHLLTERIFRTVFSNPDFAQRKAIANEVMLLPYYIASMNIEHEFYEATGRYQPFEGLCLVDTFELAEARQLALFTAENTACVDRQKRTDMFVIVGNPPYNVGQVNENDNNKNRKYETMDARVRETYSQASNATNKNALADPYVKAIRWASDRIGDEGVVAFVTNSGFLDGIAFDGMRKHLAGDFDAIYILDLGGNARKGLKVSDANVFGIRVGVSINLFVKTKQNPSKTARIFYHRTDDLWNKKRKFDFLND